MVSVVRAKIVPWVVSLPSRVPTIATAFSRHQINTCRIPFNYRSQNPHARVQIQSLATVAYEAGIGKQT